jgi:hypothetical protein
MQSNTTDSKIDRENKQTAYIGQQLPSTFHRPNKINQAL